MMIFGITLKVVLDNTSITPGQLCPSELSHQHRKGLCAAEGGRTTAPEYCPAEEMGHFPENFQPGCVSDAAVGKGADMSVPRQKPSA